MFKPPAGTQSDISIFNTHRLRRVAYLLALCTMITGCGLCTLPSSVTNSVIIRVPVGGDSTQTRTDAPTAGANLINATYDFGVTGIFTPSNNIGLDLIEQRGYLGVRVPQLSSSCAPPSCTASSIISPTLTFAYYAPPTTTTLTIVNMPLTRHDEYRPTLNARFPISDGKSHWEAWWIGANERFPTPPGPFRLDQYSTPAPLKATFTIDFGNGVDARACAGCPLDYVLFNGFIFSDLQHTTMHVYSFSSGYALAGNPLVTFDECGSPSAPTFSVAVAPSVPFTIEHCLMNHDAVSRTFTLATTSSQNWNYSYSVQGPQLNATPSPLVGNQITLSASYPDYSRRIFAVYTPTITYSDSLRESFVITATSNISPSVQTAAGSWAFTPGYSIYEGAIQFFLPLLLR